MCADDKRKEYNRITRNQKTVATVGLTGIIEHKFKFYICIVYVYDEKFIQFQIHIHKYLP